MEYNIKSEEVVFKDYFQVLKADIEHDTLEGRQVEMKRLAFHNGNSATILLYERDTSCLILVQQFRYPTTKNNDGWIIEIPAGSIEKDETSEACIIRETLEETGYQVNQPKKIHTFYNSPGTSTEKTDLFFAEVTQKDKIGQGGGVDSENEDIGLIKIKTDEIKDYLENKVIDAKTIIALQWFLLSDYC